MNERIRELITQAGGHWNYGDFNMGSSVEFQEEDIEKFSELIVRECIERAHSVGDLRGVNDDMIYGADTAAVQISKHFGVE